MKMTRYYLILFLVCCFNTLSFSTDKTAKKFRFVFLTDIHMNGNGDRDCFSGLGKALKSVGEQGIDFIITGGDQVNVDYDIESAGDAQDLYARYAEIMKSSGFPVYYAIGNHDLMWKVEKEDPMYGAGMFEHYLNKRYYSFNQNGWKFFVLDSSRSIVDMEQKEWLKKELALLDDKTPIIVVTHIPFVSLYYVAIEDEYTNRDTFSNSKEVRELFTGKNLKLVLQGHQHLYEEINMLGVQYITGGAVCAAWWGGKFHHTEEGYLLVECSDNNYTTEYVDFEWNAQPVK